MKLAIEKAVQYGADYVFVTDVGGDWEHGENTYGRPPVYWNDEKDYILKVNAKFL